jgi:hypothetical protein
VSVFTSTILIREADHHAALARIGEVASADDLESAGER